MPGASPERGFSHHRSYRPVPGVARSELLVEAAANLWADVPTQGPKMSRAAYSTTLAARIGKQKAHQKELARAGEIWRAGPRPEWSLRQELGQRVGPEPVLADSALWAVMAYEDWRKVTTLSPRAIEQAASIPRHRA